MSNQVLLLRSALAAIFSLLLAIRARKHKSLDRSGAIAGFIVITIHIAAGFRYGALILVFFLTSSKLTKYGEERKRGTDADFKEGGQRNWLQVLTNSAAAAVLALIVGAKTGWQERCLDTKESVLLTSVVGGIIGHYACCNGDTWSSEYGVLSDAQPRLITNLKKVRKGTNGAITSDGLLAALAGGAVIGLTFYLVDLMVATCLSSFALRELMVIPIATAAGLCGSLIDSLLGATLQYSGWCKVRKKVVSKPGPMVVRISGVDILDNNAVNFISILLTSLLTAIAFSFIF